MIKVRRTDIDTLRGVSVLAVVAFHVNNQIFTNGYLGVDLFFVISGYVITNSIIKNLDSGNFSFFKFYLKRAKRILPALLVVLFTTIVFASLILLLPDLKRFTESLISALAFISNIYFWSIGGYFSTNDELKPLLHLWSLSVEEQFYLFFPIFIFLIYKFFNKKKYYIIAIISVSILSFILNYKFLSSTEVVFFLFPTRIWQFGIGATFALIPNLKIKNLILENIYTFLGISLIIYNFYNIPKNLPDSTLMCAGLCLLLFKPMSEKNLFLVFFKLKPLIFIGLISYSMYLWHWPIISFLKYIYIENIPIIIMALALTLILLLSSLSWKFIEQPFLNKFSDNFAIKFFGISYVFLIATSLTIIATNNLPSRYGKFPNLIAQSIQTAYDCPPIQYRNFNGSLGCYINNKNNLIPKNILYGNSHAYMFGWSFIEYLKKTNQSGLILQVSCLPYIDKNVSLRCIEEARKRYNSIIQTKEKQNIYIGLSWASNVLQDEKGNYFRDKNFEVRKKSLDNLIDQLQKNNKNIILIGPVQNPEYDFASKYSRQIIFGGKKFEGKRDKKEFLDNYKNIIEYYKKKLGKNFIQPHKLLCDDNYCYYHDNNGSFFSDKNHLSKYGSMKMLKLFIKKD